MPFEIWPFLVSRNRFIDYRTIVAPAFLCDRKMTRILSETAGGEATPPNLAVYREIHHPEIGLLAVVFRVLLADDSSNLGLGEPVRDMYGRDIHLIEGFVCRVSMCDFRISRDLLEDIHGRLIPSYREFWRLENPGEVIPWEDPIMIEPACEMDAVQLQRLGPSCEDDLKRESNLDRASSTNGCLWELDQEYRFDDCVRHVLIEQQLTIVTIGEKLRIFEEVQGALREIGAHDVRRWTAIAVSGGRRLLVALGQHYKWGKNFISVFEPAKGKDIVGLTDDKAEYSEDHRISSLAFSSSAAHIISGSEGGTIKRWHVDLDASRIELEGGPEGQRGSVKSMCVSPTGLQVATGNDEGDVYFWEAHNIQYQSIRERHHENRITAMAFDPSGRSLLTGGKDCTVRLWTLGSTEETLIFRGHKAPVAAVCFSPDARLIVSGSADRTVRIWDATNGGQICEIGSHEAPVNSVAFSHDGHRIVSGGEDRVAKVWTRTKSGLKWEIA
jgi:hypothetical protein